MKYAVPCPWCRQDVITTAEWLMSNDRVCCMSCNKAFEVKVQINQDAEQDEESSYDNRDYWD